MREAPLLAPLAIEGGGKGGPRGSIWEMRVTMGAKNQRSAPHAIAMIFSRTHSNLTAIASHASIIIKALPKSSFWNDQNSYWLSDFPLFAYLYYLTTRTLGMELRIYNRKMFEEHPLRLNTPGFSCAFKALRWPTRSIHLCHT